MSILSFGISAIGKLLIVACFAAMFLIGLVSVVYMSLQGSEVKVPDLVGKDYSESEKELSLLGLKIHRRADRPTADKPNTVLEQLPKPGDLVKTGQTIRVVISIPGPVDETTPNSLKKGEEDDTEKIEEMISDKPKKPKANTNTNKKKAETTRDVVGNTSNSNSNSDEGNSNKSTQPHGNSEDKGNKNTAPGTKPANPSANRSVPGRPTSGETRPRSTPRP